jgi:hypothetical protein
LIISPESEITTLLADTEAAAVDDGDGEGRVMLERLGGRNVTYPSTGMGFRSSMLQKMKAKIDAHLERQNRETKAEGMIDGDLD